MSAQLLFPDPPHPDSEVVPVFLPRKTDAPLCVTGRSCSCVEQRPLPDLVIAARTLLHAFDTGILTIDFPESAYIRNVREACREAVAEAEWAAS